MSPTPPAAPSRPPVSPLVRRGTAAAALLWFLFSLALNWLGNGSHSFWDRDEPRYAVATREMIAGGDWIVPYFNGDYRFDKPILIYWLMSVPMRMGGLNEFSARAVQGIAGAATVALVFLLAVRMGASREGAHVAALAAAICPLLLVVSKAATTDAVLTLTIVAALALHWEGKRRGGFSWARHVVFWVILGLSVLEKGPPGPLVVGLAVLGDRAWGALGAWRRRRAEGAPSVAPPPLEADIAAPAAPVTWKAFAVGVLRSAVGVAVLLAVALPWAWAAWRATEGQFFDVAIGRHVVERAAKPLESHSGPFVYYIPVLLLGVFPLTMLALNALRWGWTKRRLSALRLLWSWILLPLVAFSLVRTKLPHYVTPLVPAMGLMMGLWWTRWREATGGDAPETPEARATDAPPDKPTHGIGAPGTLGAVGPVGGGNPGPGPGWWKTGAVLTIALGVVAGLGTPVAIAILQFPNVLLPACVMALFLGVGACWGGALWWKRRAARALAVCVSGYLAAILVGFVWTLPALEPLRPSKVVVNWIREHAPPETELLAVGYQEPSLVFYWMDYVTMMGRRHHERGFERLADTTRPAALVITEDRWNTWLEGHGGPPPPGVEVLYDERAYLFQRGKWGRILIVGNWE